MIINELPLSWLPLADAVVKASLILLAAALTSLILRRASAALRHLVWTLALCSALLLPVVSLALPKWQLAAGHDRVDGHGGRQHGCGGTRREAPAAVARRGAAARSRRPRGCRHRRTAPPFRARHGCRRISWQSCASRYLAAWRSRHPRPHRRRTRGRAVRVAPHTAHHRCRVAADGDGPRRGDGREPPAALPAQRTSLDAGGDGSLPAVGDHAGGRRHVVREPAARRVAARARARQAP